jgi:hypothetical protein
VSRNPTPLLRVLGAILGLLFVILGVCALVYFSEIGTLQRMAGGFAMIGTGIYFLNYGITGRRYLLGRPPI